MKASELQKLFDEHYYNDSPSEMDVHYGCECGCGGDSYTPESWDEAHKKAYESKENLKMALDKLGVEWDLEEEDYDE